MKEINYLNLMSKARVQRHIKIIYSDKCSCPVMDRCDMNLRIFIFQN